MRCKHKNLAPRQLISCEIHTHRDGNNYLHPDELYQGYNQCLDCKNAIISDLYFNKYIEVQNRKDKYLKSIADKYDKLPSTKTSSLQEAAETVDRSLEFICHLEDKHLLPLAKIIKQSGLQDMKGTHSLYFRKMYNEIKSRMKDKSIESKIDAYELPDA